MSSKNQTIEMIAIDEINILNPRVRNQKTFKNITENITKVGLKRPITVRALESEVNGKKYDLVCGQGRIEAFQSHGQTQIPAIIIDTSEEDALIMSLVENLARKQHRSIDLLRGIEALQQKGYNAKEIARKTGLSESYTKAILDLFERGEERLLAAIESGNMPVTVAISIVNSPDNEQLALQEAYENNELKGKKLHLAKRLLENRKQYGKTIRKAYKQSGKGKNPEIISAQDVINVYKKEFERKELLTRKANFVNNHLLFITEALRELCSDDNFINLLKAEGLTTMPKPISMILEGK